MKRFVVVAVVLMAVFYGLIFYPYPASSAPIGLLSTYLEGLAHVSGLLIRLFDSSTSVRGATISSLFPLQIVLDCAALDAQALFAAAVLAFPARWSQRGIGLCAGLAFITCANLARIVALYLVGRFDPARFQFWHGEVFQLGLVTAAAGAFAAWAAWTRKGQSDVAAA